MVQCNSKVLTATIVCSDPLKPCGNNTCYDPATQQCSNTRTDSDISCVNKCGNECYDSFIQECINGTVCLIGQEVCDVKYDNYSGAPILSPGPQCYDPRSYRCLNHTICHDKNRVCNGQCILYTSEYDYRVCAVDRKTLCNVSQHYTNYELNPLQVCNGTCYDTRNTLEHCVNDSLQCISSCSGACYNAATNICIKGKICYPWQDVCLTKYSPYNGSPLTKPTAECYDPWSSQCIGDALCSIERVCDGKCITGSNTAYTVCANDKHTTCNVTKYTIASRTHRVHLCNGQCFDTVIQQCINGSISCIDACGGECYDSTVEKCVNSTLHKVYEEVCEVKYNDYDGALHQSPGPYWYDPRYQKCLNHTICYDTNRICNEQCILGMHSHYVCGNDNKTLCKVNLTYNNYKHNQMQLCNGTCYDAYSGLEHCVNGNLECTSNCAGKCYDKNQRVCHNGNLCSIGFELCENISSSECYDPLNQNCLNGKLCSIEEKLCESASPKCYNPFNYKCLNGTVCNKNRACGGKCINDSKQICANDRQTICSTTEEYDKYEPNQIQLCQGVCYDSLMQQCVGQIIDSSTTTKTTTVASHSISTSDPDSSSGWISTSDFPTNVNPSVSFESNSITLITDTSTAFPSISASLTSLLTTPTAFSTKTFIYETASITTTALPGSSNTFPDFFSSSFPSISPSSSWKFQTIETDSDNSIMSTDTPSRNVIFTTDSNSQETISWTSASFLSSNSASEDTNIPSTNTEPNLHISITSSDTSSSHLTHSSNNFISTREPSSQTTASLISTYPPQGSCCATKECTNGTDCCTPHVECRCNRYSKYGDDSQECKAIVVGKNNNNSFVIAIAFNDEKVIVLHHNHILLFFLSISTIGLLLLLIRVSYFTVVHHKRIAIDLRADYNSVKTYFNKSDREKWSMESKNEV